jgi:DNA gyrase/topoisomerase IV subunit B
LLLLQVQGGHATRIEIDLDLSSGWVTVTDDGRGIPTDIHPATGKSTLETVRDTETLYRTCLGPELS